MKIRTWPVALVATIALALPADAQEGLTRVNVHVVAHDAKLIGTAVGGAHVRIRDAETGEILAEGRHEGDTGDTGRIMGARQRGQDVFTTPGAAVFTAALALDAPRRVTVEAEAPLDFPQALVRARTTLLLVPGRHLEGDGVVLELRGYIVEILSPDPGGPGTSTPLDVRARVRLLCSCPTEPGGLWEAPDVQARLLGEDGVEVAKSILRYAGSDSTYEGSLAAPAGAYTLEVLASSEETGNAGVDRKGITIE